MFLPEESLVSFRARRLANAELAFQNSFYSDTGQDWLERYAYLIPGEHSRDDDFVSQEKEFFAERYGGARIVTHGGGVRCGLDGKFSVKGVGCNPLMGRDSLQLDFAHSHGGLPLSSAIQEAVWGNVFDIALPFGAVRVAALILTGTDCVNRFRQKTPAALVVREAVLRPAHFERAAYFRPQTGVPLVTDVERVRKAVALLPDALPKPSESLVKDPHLLSSVDKLRLGVEQFSERLAAQSAVAVSRRLLHGVLTASNMGLDGRWLDFGTATAFKTHANAILGDGGLPSLWEEHLRCIPVLQNLCFYISKYYPIEDKSQLPQPAQVLQTFFVHYQRWLIDAFVNLTGFPQMFLREEANKEELARLAALLIEVATLDVKKVIITATPDWTRFGPNRLGEVLPILSLWHDHDSCESRLEKIVPDAAIRKELIASYSNLARKLMRMSGVVGSSSQAIRRLLYFNAAKTLRDISAIEASNVYGRYLQQSTVAPEDIQSFVDNASDEAQVLYGSSPPLECLMWKEHKVEIFYDSRRNQWKRVCNHKTQFFSWTALGREEQLAPMSRYWGSAHWAALFERENISVENIVMEGASG